MKNKKRPRGGKAPPAKNPESQSPPEGASWPRGLRLQPIKPVTCSVPEGLAIILSREAFGQLFGWAYSTSTEISCLGTVKQEGERFRVERFYLVPQSGSAGHTELDEDAVAELVEELLAQGKGEEARSLKCWAHSHPGMDVFWSRTDEKTCRLLVSDFLVSLVVSDDFTIRARLDLGSPIPLTIDHVPVFVDMAAETKALEKYAAEVKEKVTPKADFFAGAITKVGEVQPSEAWNEYVKECREAGLEPDAEEFEFYQFYGPDDPEFWC